MRWYLVFSLLAGTMIAPRAQTAVLRLRGGTEVRGELLNERLTVHAPYGSIPVASNWIARVQFAPGLETDLLETIHGNRLSGFISEPIRLKTGEGEMLSFQEFQAERLMLNPIVNKTARFIVLVNGDLLSGEFGLPALVATNAPRSEPIAPERIDSLWVTRGGPAEAQLTDGNQARVLYPEPSIRLRLDSGAEALISRDLLKTIYWRERPIPAGGEFNAAFGPVAVSTNAAAAPPGMVWIPPGVVLMGSPLDEQGRNTDEDPQTLVTISRGFWMGRHEVTQGEYAAVMGQNPSNFQGDTNRPVERVSWHDANEYCARLTQTARENGTLPPGCVYRLPTEAEWEYACRAGTTTRYSFGDDPDERQLREHAWFVGNSHWSTHPVGQLKPNRWGLYDMHGNVLEWCADFWSESYPGGEVTDYKGPAEGWLRVARGGSWLYGAALARCANRDDYGAGNRCSDLGFRVVLGPPP